MVDIKFVLESLKLMNFGIHEEFLLDKLQSINLIVGANGVGKTTIADALSLALGGKSDRFIHLKDLKEYIPEGAEESTIEVILKNLKDKSGNYLLVDTKEYSVDVLNIKLTIRKNNLFWSINGKGRMNRSQIQKILTSGRLKIDMQDDIYYTKKNTVDLFMGGTSHDMFNQLFGPLSLADVQERIELLQDKARNLQKKLPELHFKKENVLRDLKRAEDRKSEYERKLRLQKELEKYTEMQVWIEIIELEQITKEIEKEYLDLSENLDRQQKIHVALQEDFNDLIKDRRKLEILIEDNENAQLKIKRQIDKITSALMNHRQSISTIEGKLVVHQNRVNELNTELELLNEEYLRNLRDELILEYEVYEESMDVLNKERNQVNETLGELMEHKEQISKELKIIESKIKRITRSIEKINEDLEKETGFSITEGESIWANEREALKLTGIIQGQSWSGSVTNPLFREIYLTELGRELQGAVNYALGEYKSYILGDGEETLNRLRLVMENGKFRLSAAPFPSEVRTEPIISRSAVNGLPSELQSIIRGTLDEVVEIENPMIKSFIYGKVRAVFVKEGVHYRDLVQIARKLRCDVVTPRPSVFKSDGVFKTNVRHSLSLGSKVVDMSRITFLEEKKQDLRDELPELNLKKQSFVEEMNSLSSQQVTLTEHWSRINAEIQRILNLNPKNMIIKIQDVENQLRHEKSLISDLTEQKQNLIQEIENFSKDELVRELDLLVTKKDEFQITMQELGREIILLDSKIEQIEQDISDIREKYLIKETELVDMEQKILELLKALPKTRPSDLPSATVIRGKIIELKTRISTINATRSDVDEYHRLLALFKEIDQSEEDLEQTLNETIQILDEQKNKWISTVKSTAQDLQDMANYLLSPRLFMKISIKNSLDFKKIGLEIQFSKEGVQWQRFQSSSGGERSLITLSLFLSLHTLHLNSPIHIIDEFSQRLDEENRGHALIMVSRVLEKIESKQLEKLGEVYSTPQIILIAPTVAGSHIPKDVDLTYLLKVKRL